MEDELTHRNDSKMLVEKKLAEQAALYNLKDEYIERTISKKIDMAIKASFREADQLIGSNDIVNRLPLAPNQKSVVVLNQLE